MEKRTSRQTISTRNDQAPVSVQHQNPTDYFTLLFATHPLWWFFFSLRIKLLEVDNRGSNQAANEEGDTGQPHLIPPDDVEFDNELPPPNDFLRIVGMAKGIELWLYERAPSLEAYKDRSTLKQRLQQCAASVRQNI